MEAQFRALRQFALDGTDHPPRKEQGSMIRRYITWRNENAADQCLTALVHRANAPDPCRQRLSRVVRSGSVAHSSLPSGT